MCLFALDGKGALEIIYILGEVIMAHIIRAFIGKSKIIKNLAIDWQREFIFLPQDFAMLFLTDELFDDITEVFNLENDLDCSAFECFTTAIAKIIKKYSTQTSLAYIETEYFGGFGSQSGVLYFDGKMEIEPARCEGIINQILQKLGVSKEDGRDEFDSVHLGYYRHM